MIEAAAIAAVCLFLLPPLGIALFRFSADILHTRRMQKRNERIGL